MPRSLNDLDRWVTAATWPRTTCPQCKTGTVGYATSQSQMDSVSKASLTAAHRNEGPFEELSGTFTGTLICDDTNCMRELAMAGDWGYHYDFDDYDGRGQPQLVDTYRLRYANPALPLLAVPERTPQTVQDEIVGASNVLFVSPSAAGNRLRRAAEELMNAQRVNKSRVDRKTGKRVPATLHARIEMFGLKQPDIAHTLLAVKWIGNEASHSQEMTVADVVLCARVLNAALIALYDRSDAELKHLVKLINRRKGLGRR
ncbi:DUF4145 domain-containing protein [Cryobacterium algoricola]|uniref:DUF4145 domain-containing protein n=2 Tax=Cryobacterium algoricola TaxID=1259183 RepID=A0ABY2IHB3_9MICO|nr:DUF4145 domain-containing protein [Cryobacterium algoricola]